ncbi:MAG: helix-turn-helix domain-containing protein [archaeon]
MWSLKFKVANEDSSYAVLTKKHKVIDYFYPLDVYKEKNAFHILGVHLLEGEEKAKQAFSKDLKKHKKTIEFEQEGNMLLVLIKEEEEFYKLIYDPSLYHPAPTIIKDGVEKWNIASFQRKKLETLIKEIGKWNNKLKNFELLRLQTLNLKEIYFPKILPEIPEKQKQAFQLAMKSEYYTFPRKIDLVHLAKIAKVSTATFQENLRKAESKILPFFTKNLKF